MSTLTITSPKQELKVEIPSMFHVMIKNDDYTPFIFVITVLVELFRHSVEKAEVITQEIHDRGQASAGIYTRQIAETRVEQVMQRAREEGHPLKAFIEKVE